MRDEHITSNKPRFVSALYFWVALVVIWLVTYYFESRAVSSASDAHAQGAIFWQSLGVFVAVLAPGFILWLIARLFGFYKEPNQRRSMVVTGAIIMLLILASTK
jgi:hypothetical protein